MSLYILRWNPKISSYKTENHLELVNHIRNNEMPSDFNWSIREPEHLKKDDVFILQQVGTENDGIVMIGKFKDKCYEGDSWRKDGSKLFYADMWIMDAFDCASENFLPASRYEKLFPAIKWHGGHSGELVQDSVAEKLLNSIETDMIKAGKWHEGDAETFMNWDFEQEKRFLDDKRPSREDLDDGKILLSLKEKYLKDENEENLVQLLCCLRDSMVRVPMEIEISKNASGEEETNFYPLLLTGPNEKPVFPIYSNEAETCNKYIEEDCSLYKLTFPECVNMVKEFENCGALVLDAFTEPFLIDMELADLILQLKYKDEADDNQ